MNEMDYTYANGVFEMDYVYANDVVEMDYRYVNTNEMSSASSGAITDESVCMLCRGHNSCVANRAQQPQAQQHQIFVYSHFHGNDELYAYITAVIRKEANISKKLYTDTSLPVRNVSSHCSTAPLLSISRPSNELLKRPESKRVPHVLTPNQVQIVTSAIEPRAERLQFADDSDTTASITCTTVSSVILTDSSEISSDHEIRLAHAFLACISLFALVTLIYICSPDMPVCELGPFLVNIDGYIIRLDVRCLLSRLWPTLCIPRFAVSRAVID